jgi:F-type H+-transporting ATPase subunit epsilon
MTAMPNHAAVITTLRPGILRVEAASGQQEYVVTGGFAELGENLSVLAERAVAKADLDKSGYDTMLAEAKSTLETAKANGGAVDDMAKTVADLEAIGAELGLS